MCVSWELQIFGEQVPLGVIQIWLGLWAGQLYELEQHDAAKNKVRNQSDKNQAVDNNNIIQQILVRFEE